jgi:hypothetical protein
MQTAEEYKRREQIMKSIFTGFENLEKELKLEIEKVKNPKAKLPNQQLDHYVIYAATIFGAYNTELKNQTVEIDRLIWQLLEICKEYYYPQTK